eukprot:8304624-Pyramimonas_sp.AAC.1
MAAMSLVSVMRSGGHLLLVGDPKQLPHIVLSRKAADRGLRLSIFDRLHNALGEDTSAVAQLACAPSSCPGPAWSSTARQCGQDSPTHSGKGHW